MTPQVPSEFQPLPFVVAIFARLESGALLFLGTGTVIGESLILTCMHVVQHPESADDYPEFRSSLVIRASDSTDIESDSTDIEVVGEAFDPPLDLAVLRSPSPLAIESVPFATMLDQSFVDHFDHLDLRVVGFPDSSQGKKQSTFSPLQYTLTKAAGGLLETLQLDGGIDEGCSGGPALVLNNETWQCFGLAVLGGCTAPISTVICADNILGSKHLGLKSDQTVLYQPFDQQDLRQRSMPSLRFRDRLSRVGAVRLTFKHLLEGVFCHSNTVSWTCVAVLVSLVSGMLLLSRILGGKWYSFEWLVILWLLTFVLIDCSPGWISPKQSKLNPLTYISYAAGLVAALWPSSESSWLYPLGIALCLNLSCTIIQFAWLERHSD